MVKSQKRGLQASQVREWKSEDLGKRGGWSGSCMYMQMYAHVCLHMCVCTTKARVLHSAPSHWP